MSEYDITALVDELVAQGMSEEDAVAYGLTASPKYLVEKYAPAPETPSVPETREAPKETERVDTVTRPDGKEVDIKTYGPGVIPPQPEGGSSGYTGDYWYQWDRYGNPVSRVYIGPEASPPPTKEVPPAPPQGIFDTSYDAKLAVYWISTPQGIVAYHTDEDLAVLIGGTPEKPVYTPVDIKDGQAVPKAVQAPPVDIGGELKPAAKVVTKTREATKVVSVVQKPTTPTKQAEPEISFEESTRLAYEKAVEEIKAKGLTREEQSEEDRKSADLSAFLSGGGSGGQSSGDQPSPPPGSVAGGGPSEEPGQKGGAFGYGETVITVPTTVYESTSGGAGQEQPSADPCAFIECEPEEECIEGVCVPKKDKKRTKREPLPKADIILENLKCCDPVNVMKNMLDKECGASDDNELVSRFLGQYAAEWLPNNVNNMCGGRDSILDVMDQIDAILKGDFSKVGDWYWTFDEYGNMTHYGKDIFPWDDESKGIQNKLDTIALFAKDQVLKGTPPQIIEHYISALVTKGILGPKTDWSTFDYSSDKLRQSRYDQPVFDWGTYMGTEDQKAQINAQFGPDLLPILEYVTSGSGLVNTLASDKDLQTSLAIRDWVAHDGLWKVAGTALGGAALLGAAVTGGLTAIPQAAIFAWFAYFEPLNYFNFVRSGERAFLQEWGKTPQQLESQFGTLNWAAKDAVDLFCDEVKFGNKTDSQLQDLHAAASNRIIDFSNKLCSNVVEAMKQSIYTPYCSSLKGMVERLDACSKAYEEGESGPEMGQATIHGCEGATFSYTDVDGNLQTPTGKGPWTIDAPVGSRISYSFTKPGAKYPQTGTIAIQDVGSAQAITCDPNAFQFEKLELNYPEGIRFPDASPDIKITVDGMPLRVYGPGMVNYVPPGNHEICTQRPGEEPVCKSVNVFEGKITDHGIPHAFKPYPGSPGGPGSPGAPGASKPEEPTLIMYDEPCRSAVIWQDEAIVYPEIGKWYSIDPGIHVIKIEKEGYKPWTKQITIFKEDKYTISPYLEYLGTKGKAEPTESVKKRVFVSTKPYGSKVLVDGTFSGQWTPCYLDLAPGCYTISVYKSGYDEMFEKVFVGDSVLRGNEAEQACKALKT